MAAGISIVLILAAALLGLCFIAALVLVLVFSASRRGGWSPAPHEGEGHDL